MPTKFINLSNKLNTIESDPFDIKTKEDFKKLKNKDIIIIQGIIQEYKFENNKYIFLVYIDFLRDCKEFSTLDKNNLQPLVDGNQNEYDINKTINKFCKQKISIKCKVIKKTYIKQIKTFYNILSLFN